MAGEGPPSQQLPQLEPEGEPRADSGYTSCRVCRQDTACLLFRPGEEGGRCLLCNALEALTKVVRRRHLTNRECGQFALELLDIAGEIEAATESTTHGDEHVRFECEAWAQPTRLGQREAKDGPSKLKSPL